MLRFFAREWLWLVTFVIAGAMWGVMNGTDAVESTFLAVGVGYPASAAIRLTFWAIRTVGRTASPDSPLGAAIAGAKDSWAASAPPPE